MFAVGKRAKETRLGGSEQMRRWSVAIGMLECVLAVGELVGVVSGEVVDKVKEERRERKR